VSVLRGASVIRALSVQLAAAGSEAEKKENHWGERHEAK